MKYFVLLTWICAFVLSGCETVHQGAKEVGKPIGATMKTVGGVSEGAIEGYSDKPESNPYNR